MPDYLINMISGYACEVFPEKTGISVSKLSKADAFPSMSAYHQLVESLNRTKRQKAQINY